MKFFLTVLKLKKLINVEFKMNFRLMKIQKIL